MGGGVGAAISHNCTTCAAQYDPRLPNRVCPIELQGGGGGEQRTAVRAQENMRTAAHVVTMSMTWAMAEAACVSPNRLCVVCRARTYAALPASDTRSAAPLPPAPLALPYGAPPPSTQVMGGEAPVPPRSSSWAC